MREGLDLNKNDELNQVFVLQFSTLVQNLLCHPDHDIYAGIIDISGRQVFAIPSKNHNQRNHDNRADA